jgi:hypothetical protein
MGIWAEIVQNFRARTAHVLRKMDLPQIGASPIWMMAMDALSIEVGAASTTG